jgi:catechol 2,3-dioxygenase-like lactoylglutathione lyase family enzyme
MLRRFSLSFGVLSLLLACSGVRASDHPELVTAVDSIGMTVADLDRSVDFYTRVLSFEKISELETAGADYEHLEGVFGARMRTARLRLGDEFVELTQYLAPEGKPFPATHANDRWFQHVAIITSNMDQAYKRLRENKVPHASTGPQLLPAWNPNAGGIQAFYFRDPDGHFLEVLAFPPDKGLAKWHQTDRLFLGIDHTAIVISNTEASLHLYRDVLGLRVVGESENYGTEQEHLNNVFGARLRITSVRAESGPGVEFLEYLAPGDGRPYPADEKANDLVHWQTRFLGTDAAQAEQALRKFRSTFISTGIVEMTGSDSLFRRSFVARDPDGHAFQVAQQ